MNQKEINHDDELQKQFVENLLDSYFLFRRPLPEAGFIQENKTTQQIQDELEPMYTVTTGNIVGYMLNHSYSTTTEQDGTVVWAIWRQV